jgi:uncharacterized protein (DUF305 family)
MRAASGKAVFRRTGVAVTCGMPPTRLAAVLVALASLGCGTATTGATTGAPTPPAARRANEAAVAFVSGMIHHHAQAVLMASWAPTHDAGPAVRTLCQRILISQRDEIAIMQTWLRDNGEPVPEPNAGGMAMVMGGAQHLMLMPGMLTEEQMTELDRTRGPEFDRLFVTFMIQHHQGAITMVDELFGSHGGTEDEFIYKFASDVFADQTAEIDRMQGMLAAMTAAGRR